MDTHSLLSQIPGYANTDTILRNSAQMGTQESQDYFNQPHTGNPSSSILSGIDSLNQPSQPQPQAEDKGNWLTRLIPTGTSILGGLLGSLTDEFTGPLGTIGGSAIGNDVGKTIENFLEGKQTTAGDLATGALEGAAGAGIGKVGEAGLGLAGKALTGAGEKGAATAAENAANQQAVAEAQATRNVFGGVPKATTEGLYDNQNLAGAQGLAKEVGINHNDPQAMVDVANTALTPLSDIRKNAIAAAGPINTSGAVDETGAKVAPGIDDIINGALHNAHPLTGESLGQDLTSTLGSTDQIAVKKNTLGLPNNASTQFIKTAQQILQPVTGNKVDPNDLLNASIKVGQNAQAARELAANTSASDVQGVNAAKAQAWTNLDKSLNDILYNRPEVDQFVSTTPAVMTTDDTGGNAALANVLNNRIGNIQSGTDVNKVMSEFMNLRNQGNAALKVAGNPSSTGNLAAVKQAAGMGAPTVDAQGNPIIDTLAASTHAPTKGLGKVLQVLNKNGIGDKSAIGIGNLLTRIAPLAGLAGGETVAGSPNQEAGATSGTVVGAGMQPVGVGSTGNAREDILNSNAPNAIPIQSLLSLMEHGGGYNVPTEMGTLAPMAATSLGQMEKANSAQSQLNQLISLLNQSGGAQGPIGGFLSKLGAGITGGPAGQYDQQARQLTDEINQLTGSHVAAPSLTMNQPAANDILAQLQNTLASYGGNGGTSSL